MSTSSLLPPYDLPFMSENVNTYEWFRLLSVLSDKLGNGSDLTLQSVSDVANQALVTANSAEATTITLSTEVTNLNGSVAAAQTAAATALSVATSAASTQANFLLRNNNLSDISNVATARSNLGLDVVQISTTFDSCASVITKYIPLTRGYNLAANFAGSVIWSGVNSTLDATFTFRYIRSNVTTTIGTMSLIHSGNFPGPVSGIAVSFQAGDVLTISCPSDVTLAQVGVSLKLTNA